MKNQKWTWILSLIMAFVITAGAATGASVRPNADSLPQTKDPSSAKLKITGRVIIGDSSTNANSGEPGAITGSGLLAGNDFELELTVKSGATNGPDITAREKLVGGKLYIKISNGSNDSKWVVSDAPAGIANGIAGITGLDPRRATAYTVKMLGKETLDGVATTKYQIDADLAKLSSAAGVDASTIGDSTLRYYEWVGDADMYIHRVDYSLTLSGNSGSIDGLEEFTIDFYDFDVPATITAPTDVQAINVLVDTSVLGGISGNGGMSTSAGMPGMPVGMPMGMPTGMPTTGSGAGNSTLPLALLALSFGLVLSGVAVKRRAYAGQRV